MFLTAEEESLGKNSSARHLQFSSSFIERISAPPLSFAQAQAQAHFIWKRTNHILHRQNRFASIFVCLLAYSLFIRLYFMLFIAFIFVYMHVFKSDGERKKKHSYWCSTWNRRPLDVTKIHPEIVQCVTCARRIFRCCCRCWLHFIMAAAITTTTRAFSYIHYDDDYYFFFEISLFFCQIYLDRMRQGQLYKMKVTTKWVIR